VREDIRSKEMLGQVEGLKQFIKKQGVELALVSLGCEQAVRHVIRPSLTQLTIVIVQVRDLEYMA
jgi:hypothetical protein